MFTAFRRAHGKVLEVKNVDFNNSGLMFPVKPDVISSTSLSDGKIIERERGILEFVQLVLCSNILWYVC